MLATGSDVKNEGAVEAIVPERGKRITLSPGLEMDTGGKLPRMSKQEGEEQVERFPSVMTEES